MLEAFKEKLHTVQQDLSSGIQKLRTRKSPSFYSLSSASTSSGLTGSVSAPSLVDADAGGEILDYYQRSWQLTHELSEDNVQAANACSERLRALQEVCRRDAAGIAFISRDAGALPKLAEELSDLVNLTAQLQCLCDEVDTALAYFQVVSETQLFQERKLDAKFAFALHREAKIAEITESKARLTKEHQTRMQAKQKKQAVELEEKQRVYQNAFEHDLQLYKTTGLIANTIPSAGSEAEGMTGQLGVDDVSRLADVLATSQVHAAETPLAQLLLNHLSVSTRSRRQPCPAVDLEQFGPLTLEEDEHNFQEFLSDVKLEDSGIAGSDSQSTAGETEANDIVDG